MAQARRHRDAWMTLFAALAPVAVAAAMVPVRSVYASTAAALTMAALIAATAVVATRAAGWVATVSSVLWFDFFLTVPYYRFTISHRPDLETTIAILVVGGFVTELAERSRRHWASARESRAELASVAALAVSVAGGARPEDVIESVEASLTELLGLRGCHFDPLPEDPPLARVVAGGTVSHVGLAWPTRNIGLPGPQSEIDVIWHGRFEGRFVLTPTTARPVTRESLAVAVALVDVAAGSIAERHRMA
ncbi:MAG TPA: DUF4118 domain-containing protein [Acidimicrobiales bacterium]|nr:DUF4118 domain-containing protein [Acidimicrobiales bacterium]